MPRQLSALSVRQPSVLRVFFDTNVYSHLAEDVDLRRLLNAAVGSGAIEVIVTPVVQEELEAGPHEALLRELPLTFAGEGILLAGGRVGDHLSSGTLMLNHLGASKNVNDAILAESAELADVAVSEDRRFLRRLRSCGAVCKPMDLAQFRNWLERSTA